MSEYKVEAFSLGGWENLELRPVSLSITESLSSPAVSMRGSFAIQRWPASLTSIKVTRNGHTIMEGKIDNQRNIYGAGGMELELEARNSGAALLDNEAMPRSYQNIGAAALFADLIAPYGFLLAPPDSAATLAEFTVRKEQSLWEAFTSYTRRVYGVEPHVVRNVVYIAVPNSPNTLVLGGEEHPFSALEEVISNYQPISRVVVRGADGSYVAAVNNPSVQGLEISRVRYLIPAGEFTAAPVLDAQQRIRRSMGRMRKVIATIPGYLDVPAGQAVSIRHPRAAISNLLAEEAAFILDGRGAMTKLTLTSSVYY